MKNGSSTQCRECHLNRKGRRSKTDTYGIWCGLFTRCYNKNHATYKYYGAKGIKVSARWHFYENFLEDMGHRPLMYQIDRIDNTKGYSKENCRWLPKYDNTSRQHNRLIDITGLRFGKWTVFDRDSSKLDRDIAYWHCVCDCGKNSSVNGSMLRTGKTTQCRDCKNKSHIGWSKRFKKKEKLNECGSTSSIR